MIDVAMAQMQANRRFWDQWKKRDRSLEASVMEQPGADGRVLWSDPEARGNYIGWLLEELLSDVERLVDAGRLDWGERVLAAAEKLTDTFVPANDLRSMLVANVFARLLIAGWRDSDDPVATLEFQLGQAAFNVDALKQAVSIRADKFPGIPVRFPDATGARLFFELLRLRPAALLPHLSFRFCPGLTWAAPRWFPLSAGVPEPVFGAGAGRHARAADELALAMGLPYGLAPVGDALESFLDAVGPSLPAGDAVSLGAGDGAEPLRLVRVPAFRRVVAVDHSVLAVERMLRMGARLKGLGGADRVVPVLADVRSYACRPGSASLVVANHVVEYLEDFERQLLYRGVAACLAPGGALFLNVHLARGPRFEGLSLYANITKEADDRRVRVVIGSLVPANPGAVQVQHFFLPGGLEEELAQAGLASGPDLSVSVSEHDSGAGFVEQVAVVRKPLQLP
jgi:hypothetical protein